MIYYISDEDKKLLKEIYYQQVFCSITFQSESIGHHIDS